MKKDNKAFWDDFEGIQKDAVSQNAKIRPEFPEVRKPLDVLDLEGVQSKDVSVQTNLSDERKYHINVVSESINLNEFVSIMLTETGISFSSASDVPSLYVDIQGDYSLDTIIDILQRVSSAVSFTFSRVGNLCVIQKFLDGSISGMSVLSYHCKYVSPSGVAVTSFMEKMKGVFVYVSGMDIVAIGSRSDVEVIRGFLEGFDKDIFQGYKVSFIVCPDVTVVIEKVKSIFTSLSPDALNVVNVIPITGTVLGVISKVPAYVVTWQSHSWG